MAVIKSVNDEEVRQIIAKRRFTRGHPSPLAWEDQVLYFLLPDRFSDGNEEGFGGSTPKFQVSDTNNAIQNENDARTWRDSGVVFNGGTLNGLKSKIPYLQTLGVTALWIGPLFRQIKSLETYHGYAVQDFLDVDPRFGTREELQDLVKVAHDAGIYVLLDIILNHSGDVFQYKSKDIPDYSNGTLYEVEGWYDSDRHRTVPMTGGASFPDAAIWPSELQNKDCFTRKGQIKRWDDYPETLDGDFFTLKDLALGNNDPDNFERGAALSVLCEAYKFWIAYADIDGYRIDTVKHMGDGPTRFFASAIHEYATSIGKDRFLLIGEITGTRAFETVETTGIDAALGIGNVQANLWQVPKGMINPTEYFDLFRNALYLKKGSHTWFRNKVVTMIDDHDQVWKGQDKERFCGDELGQKTVKAALALNLLTLGIPCIYFGTEQSFDGRGGSTDGDRYIREAMFGGKFGPFRSKNRHCFDDNHDVYQAVRDICKLRKREMTLCRGRQYLREISGDGVHFDYPKKIGNGNMTAIIPWSRLFAGEEALCAINTDPDNELTQWVTLDREVHPPGSTLTLLYSSTNPSPSSDIAPLTVQDINGRSALQISVPKGGVSVFK